MAKVRLEVGAELDLLSPRELDETIGKHASIWQEAARGLKHLGLPTARGTVSAGNVTLGAGLDTGDGVYLGPREGFWWRVIRVSVDGLAAGDLVKLYKGGIQGSRFVAGIFQANGSVFTPSRGLILKPGDNLQLTGSGLSATGTITMSGEAIEAPGVLQWKLIGG